MKYYILILKSAVITVLLMLIWSKIVYATKLTNITIIAISYALYSSGIYMSHYFYKKEYTMKYIDGLKLGIGISSLTALFYGLTTYVSLKLDKSGVITNEIKSKLTQIIKSKGLGSSIEAVKSQMDIILKPAFMAFCTFLSMLILGMLLSLIISIFTKTKEDNGQEYF